MKMALIPLLADFVAISACPGEPVDAVSLFRTDEGGRHEITAIHDRA
jgi:hypothetical protein